MTIFLLALFVWTLGSSAGLEDTFEDWVPGALGNQDVDMDALEEARPAYETGLAWDVFGENEEWQHKRPSLGKGSQPACQKQGYPVESAGSTHVVDLEKTETSLLKDPVVPVFSDRLETENNPVTYDNSASPTVDTITSRESLNLTIPSEDVLNILAEKSINVNLSTNIPPDFRSSPTPSNRASKPSRSTNEKTQANLCPSKNTGPSSRSVVPLQRAFQPVPPPLPVPLSPCQSTLCPTATHATHSAARKLQPTRPSAHKSKCRKCQKRGKVISPTPSCSMCRAGKRARIKQRKLVIKPEPRPVGCSKSKKRPRLERHFRKSGTSRSTCRIQQKKHKPRRKRTTENNDVLPSARKLPVLKSRRKKAQPNKMVIYIA